MSTPKTIHLRESDPLIQAKFQDLLEKMDFAEICYFGDSNEVLDLNTLPSPMRAGAILDRLGVMMAGGQVLEIGLGSLDVAQNLWHSGEQETRLTEKETALLQILHAARGASISRADLLEQVWGYQDGVETHTIETHIYRLRQKIEADPASPRILMTDEDGYFLNLK